MIKDHIIGFEVLVKNRLGPYHIVIKAEDGRYITGQGSFWDEKYKSNLSPKDNAFHFDDWYKNSPTCWPLFSNDLRIYRSRGLVCDVYLTTVAGDILLTECDFKPGVLK